MVLAGCTRAVAAAEPASPPPPSPTVSSNTVPGESVPVADPIYPDYGNPAIDVLHYGLDLSWDAKTFTGQATIALRAVSAVTAITLDFSPAYTIDGATLNGAPVTATIANNDLSVALAHWPPAPRRRWSSSTTASRRPTPMPSHRSDVEPLGLTVTKDGGLLWTMQEPFGAFTWYPSNDQPSDKALYDIAVTVPPGWAASPAAPRPGRPATRSATARPTRSRRT